MIFSKNVFAGLLTLLISGYANAAFLIDDFSTDQTVSTPDLFDSINGTGIIGGTREVNLTNYNGSSNSFSANNGSGTFTVNTGAFGISQNLVYSNLGGIDLLQGSFYEGFRYNISAITGDVAITGEIFEAGTFNTVSSSQLFINSPGEFYQSFPLGAGTPGENAAIVQIIITGITAGESVTFSSIGIGKAGEAIPSAVPLPASYLFLGSALLVLHRVKRR